MYVDFVGLFACIFFVYVIKGRENTLTNNEKAL